MKKEKNGEKEMEQRPQKGDYKELIESLEIEEKSVISYSFINEEDEKESK